MRLRRLSFRRGYARPRAAATRRTGASRVRAHTDACGRLRQLMGVYWLLCAERLDEKEDEIRNLHRRNRETLDVRPSALSSILTFVVLARRHAGRACLPVSVFCLHMSVHTACPLAHLLLMYASFLSQFHPYRRRSRSFRSVQTSCGARPPRPLTPKTTATPKPHETRTGTHPPQSLVRVSSMGLSPPLQ